MSNELLLLINKRTDTINQQTRTRPRETLDFKMNKQLKTFSISPPLSLLEEGKWMIAVTSFETTNSVLNITDENKNFSNTTPSCWTSRAGVERNNKPRELLRLREQSDIQIHVKEIKKRKSNKNRKQRK